MYEYPRCTIDRLHEQSIWWVKRFYFNQQIIVISTNNRYFLFSRWISINQLPDWLYSDGGNQCDPYDHTITFWHTRINMFYEFPKEAESCSSSSSHLALETMSYQSPKWSRPRAIPHPIVHLSNHSLQTHTMWHFVRCLVWPSIRFRYSHQRTSREMKQRKYKHR